jgi:hypothetical protein
MKLIRHILIAICLASIAWCIGQSIAEWYVDQLKSSGGIVTASELLGAKFIPYAVAIFVFGGYLKIATE